MTADANDPRMELSKISKLLIEDLLNTPDAELVQDAAKDESLKEAGISAKNAYQKAIQAVGAKRFQTARAEMKTGNLQPPSESRNIDALMAHKIIAKLTAANDSNLTLAARNLNNISDEDAIELVKELVELGAIKKDDQF
jgi:hypothetical protein